jgi:NADH:ubiquinone oxidoreductase subunit H
MIKRLIFFIGILLRVAFLTLVERKILSFIQLRKGPNLVGILGLIQPIGDGLKLVSKQTIYNLFRNLFIFYVPLFFFFFSLVIWISILEMQGMKISNNFLFFLFLRRFGALLIFLSGWRGGRTFSFLGGIRASAQIISYEVVLSFFFLIPIIYFFNLSFHLLNEKVFILSN